MAEFLAAYAVFLALHLAPRVADLRARLIARLGRGRYVALYSALSVGALAWTISAALRAPTVELWPSGPETAAAAVALMLPASILLAAGAARPNPHSVSILPGAAPASPDGVAALTRHPLLWGLFLWALAHLIANGDAVAAMMFGGFALFALAGVAAFERRAPPRSGRLAARLRRAASARLAVEAAAGAALWLALLRLHPALIGPDPLAWF
ncbi:NnrU family protein [Oceanicella actignis]|uniref:NnrU family protein n=1 Tax=Oceanicella actignis TaxID=1189325 RepID=UPI00125B5FD0|nr:NnrU family protein [Oceanicella actignis]TYO88462.1 putative membrane protein [Oceanicella actignis]